MKQSTRKSLRTVFQGILGFTAALPILLQSMGVPLAAGVGATFLTVSGIVAKVMNLALDTVPE